MIIMWRLKYYQVTECSFDTVIIVRIGFYAHDCFTYPEKRNEYDRHNNVYFYTCNNWNQIFNL